MCRHLVRVAAHVRKHNFMCARYYPLYLALLMSSNPFPVPLATRDEHTDDDTDTFDRVTTETSDFFLSASAVFALVLIVSGNYLADLFNMNLRHVLSHPLAKHIFAILTLYFFVVLLDASRTDQPYWKQIIRVMLLYVLFIIFVKTEARFAVLSICLLALVYFISNWKAFRNVTKTPITRDERRRTQIAQILLGTLLFLSLLFGFLIHIGYKSHKFDVKQAARKGTKRAWNLWWFMYSYDKQERVDNIPFNKLWHYAKCGARRVVGSS